MSPYTKSESNKMSSDAFFKNEERVKNLIGIIKNEIGQRDRL